MNSEIIILLSSISTGIIALFALCIKFSLLSKCFRVSLCWNCIEWERDVKLEKDTIEQNANTPTRTNNNDNNFSNV
jgi:hypothetical protein